MDENMNDLFANVKKMVDSGNIPPEIKQMMNNMQGSNNNSQSNNFNSSNNNSNADINNILNQVSPEMLNNLSSMLNSSNSNSNNNSNGSGQKNNFNLDMNTIMKMKSIMENMNNKDDPRANLLYSLKPYLRDSKKNKVDQYVNMLNISKMADFMNKPNDNKKKD